jgi:hypothetical protein
MRDRSELFEALKRSPFRAKFRLGPKDRAYLGEKGMEEVLAHARRFVAERLAPAHPPRDGKQTPWRGHPVFVAQHATATCCRGCLMKWHRIEKGRELTQSEREYVVEVIGQWLRGQMSHEDAQPKLF